MSSEQEKDLYKILEVERTATQIEIKKAYRKAALKYHPDKATDENRDGNETRFKVVAQAYEILSDEDKRAAYDEYGMAAFDSSRPGGSAGPFDMDDILSQMFGFGMGGGMPGMGGARRGPSGPRKGQDEQQVYEVDLEDLYKGKTVKFAANKKVNCGTCKGTGSKEKIKPIHCDKCDGQGRVEAFKQIGPGMMRREIVVCDNCKGSGQYFKEKDRCKKCKGTRTVHEKKLLELYIPRGSAERDLIVLEGEADQDPDSLPGDLIFILKENKHDIFKRIGVDLSANLEITLAEALTGFSRVVLTHLDGRGISITHERGQVLKPDEVLRVPGEGMPPKRGDNFGDLYLIVKITFPENDWIKDNVSFEALKKLLPKPAAPIEVKEVDEVVYEDNADINEMGAGSQDPRYRDGWDDDDEHDGGARCQTQ